LHCPGCEYRATHHSPQYTRILCSQCESSVRSTNIIFGITPPRLNGRKRLRCDDQVTGTGISEILAFDLPETKNEQSGDHVNSVAISNLNGDRGPNQVGEMAEVSPDYSIDRVGEAFIRPLTHLVCLWCSQGVHN
jgi:hypothetical protein